MATQLDKSSISEVKAYQAPPPIVEMVLSAVMVLFEEKADWATAKRKIGEPNFLSQIKVRARRTAAAVVTGADAAGRPRASTKTT